jgi:hypothetical protein
MVFEAARLWQREMFEHACVRGGSLRKAGL